MPSLRSQNRLLGLHRLWREGRTGLELAALLRDPIFRLAAPFATRPGARLQVRLVVALGSLGAPGLFSRDCLEGECCAEVRRAAERPFPAAVGFVSIYSRRDAIVDWRACLDPAAEHVEV